MIIHTERLELIPLTNKQLDLWLNDLQELENELDCSYQGETLDNTFRQIVKEQLKIVNEDEKNYVWHSFFWLVRKEDRTVVGSADFKGLPDKNGDVEIGYGLGKEFEHHGYMTEAVKAMCDWALKQKMVTGIIAETMLWNVASQNILKRCSFRKEREGESYWWKLQR